MIEMSIAEYRDALKAQGFPFEDVVFKCPMCDTPQTANDLIAAGAGKDLDEVEKYLAFSCIGRWTHQKPPPEKKQKGSQIGCNWTLGGFLGISDLVVVDDQGKRHLCFIPLTKEAAESYHAARRLS